MAQKAKLSKVQIAKNLKASKVKEMLKNSEEVFSVDIDDNGPNGMEGLEEFLEDGESTDLSDPNPIVEAIIVEDEIVPETAPEVVPEPEIKKVVIRKVAKYPGIYPSPTKQNPGRFIANYRLNKKTIKIVFFDNEEWAHEAKELIMNPPVEAAVEEFLEAVIESENKVEEVIEETK